MLQAVLDLDAPVLRNMTKVQQTTTKYPRDAAQLPKGFSFLWLDAKAASTRLKC